MSMVAGEVVIAADGEGEALALARAQVVLTTRLDAKAVQGMVVSLRTDVSRPASWVAGLAEGGALVRDGVVRHRRRR